MTRKKVFKNVMSIITETSPQAKIEINANHSHVKHILIAVAVYFHFEMPRKDHINSTSFSLCYSECWYVWILEDLVRGVNDYPLNVWCTLLGKIVFLAR